MARSAKNTTRTERLAVPACGGIFSVWWTPTSSKNAAYYSKNAANDEGEGMNVSFLREGAETEIKTVVDIVNCLVAAGCSMQAETTRDPRGFAWLVGFLLRRGRVLDDPRWVYLEEYCDLRVAESGPHVDGDHLYYVSYRVSLAPLAVQAERFEVNLVTGEVKVSLIPQRGEPSGK